MRRADDNLVAGRTADAWMAEAVGLAESTHPHPNPRVGAIVLSDTGDVVATAAHTGSGGPHAEAAALEAAGAAAAGGILIVSLEPCIHHGHTPPCVDAILSAGIATVIGGPVDPDHRVDGAGYEKLRTAGVDVSSDVSSDVVVAADPGYFHHRRTGRPFVTVKYAMTADGQVAAADGSSRWITGPAARRDAHRLRSHVDAVMVGAGTLRSDDPLLDVRLDGYDGPQPRPVVIAGAQPLPHGARLWQRDPIVFAPSDVDLPGTEVVAAWGPAGVDLETSMKELADRGLLHVLVEGGPHLSASLLAAGLVDQLIVYVGGRVAGGSGLAPFAGHFATMGDDRSLVLTDVAQIGSDVRITYTLEAS